MSAQVLFVTIVGAIFASTGFWTFLIYMFKRRDKHISAEGRMLRGLAHDRICFLGASYIQQGYVTKDDYENLYDYLYVPYTELGGNGAVKKVMLEVEKLPIR